MRKSILFVISVTFLFLISFGLPRTIYAYEECETGGYTACNTNGSKTGHWMNVTKNSNGTYTCSDQGQYQCNHQPYAGCQPSGLDKCVATLPGNPPPAANIMYGPVYSSDTSNNCGKQAAAQGIVSTANLFCVCGMDGAPACPSTPTSTPVPQTPTDTTTPIPAVDPTPTSIPETNVTVVLGLPGIGYNGSTPKHTTRNVTVELYGPTVKNPGGPGTTVLATAQGTVTYDDGSDNNAGYFVSKTPLSFPNLPTSDYQLLIKVQQYLYKLAINASNTDNPTVFSLAQNSTTVLDPVLLVPGNVVAAGGHANNISILDWNTIISCYGGNATTGSCPSPIRPSSASDLNLADLNDDGVVDFADLNLWLRSWKLLVSNNAPGCDSGSCQGD